LPELTPAQQAKLQHLMEQINDILQGTEVETTASLTLTAKVSKLTGPSNQITRVAFELYDVGIVLQHGGASPWQWNLNAAPLNLQAQLNRPPIFTPGG
jgi:hypothetical protein